MAYELYYWSGLPGRGEFIRLAFEESVTPYRDVALEEDGDELTSSFADDPKILHPSFAPPFLKHGDVVVGQVAAILQYLGPRLGLAPRDEAQSLWVHQIQLTIADITAEAHDTHHPVDMAAYYEDQKAEARTKAKGFRQSRIPKFLDWFETILVRNPEGPTYLVGNTLTYADLSLFHLIDGLIYAFPNTMKDALKKAPNVKKLHAAVKARPNIKAYLKSARRTPFNENDIFRHYKALDKRAA